MSDLAKIIEEHRYAGCRVVGRPHVAPSLHQAVVGKSFFVQSSVDRITERRDAAPAMAWMVRSAKRSQHATALPARSSRPSQKREGEIQKAKGIGLRVV